MLKTYFSLFFSHSVIWWVVFDNKAWGGGGEGEECSKVLSVQFLPVEPPKHDVFKVRRFLAYLLLQFNSIQQTFYLIFYTGYRQVKTGIAAYT